MQEEAKLAVKTLEKIRRNGSNLAISIIRNIESIRQTSKEHNSQSDSLSRYFTQREKKLLNKIFKIIRSASTSTEAARLIKIIEEKLT